MNLVDRLESVIDTKVDTKVPNDSGVSSLLIYSIYYLYKEFPDFFNISDDVFENIKALIRTGTFTNKDGADKLMTFYNLNKYNFKNDSNFKKTYEGYLEELVIAERKLGTNANLEIYIMVDKKFREYERSIKDDE